MRTDSHSPRSGFTLAEILLAMLVFAIAISTILALLARSIETADEIIQKDEAIQLSSALESFMSEIPFTEAYEIVATAQPDPGGLYAFHYHDDLIGTVTPAIRLIDDTGDESERTGRLFYVQLSESPANPYANNPVPPGNTPRGIGDLPTDPNDSSDFYDSAVLVMFAKFFSVPVVLSSTEFEEFRTRGTPNTNDDLQPVFSYNFAVRR